MSPRVQTSGPLGSCRRNPPQGRRGAIQRLLCGKSPKGSVNLFALKVLSAYGLMEFLTLLNHDVAVLVRPSRESPAPGHVSVHAVK